VRRREEFFTVGRGGGRRDSVQRKDGKVEEILYSWKERKDEFGTGVFGGGRRKVRGRGRRKSVQWEGEEEGGILHGGKRMRKEGIVYSGKEEEEEE
jgi:hypothetical protein